MNPVDSYQLHQEISPKMKPVKSQYLLVSKVVGRAQIEYRTSFNAQQILTFPRIISCHTNPVESYRKNTTATCWHRTFRSV